MKHAVLFTLSICLLSIYATGDISAALETTDSGKESTFKGNSPVLFLTDLLEER